MEGIEIRTERLLLRTYRAGDVDAMHGYYSDPSVCQHLLHEPWDRATTEETVLKRTRRTSLHGPDPAIALVVEHDGVVVGDVAAWACDATGCRAEIGWVFDPRHAGKGYATEAVRALIDLVFGQPDLHRIVARMDARNTASARLCERVGMVREAHLRRDLWTKGEWADTVTYGLLATDPRPA